MLKPSQALILKTGPEGARAYSGGEIFAVRAPEVRVIDTVGAGDTFNAAFLAALVSGADLHVFFRSWFSQHRPAPTRTPSALRFSTRSAHCSALPRPVHR